MIKYKRNNQNPIKPQNSVDELKQLKQENQILKLESAFLKDRCLT